MSTEAFLVTSPTTSAMRALNYAPGIDRLRRGSGKLRSRRLGDLVSRIGGSFGAVFTRVDCEPRYGVPLYSQVDTFSAEPEGRYIRRDAMPRPDDQRVRRWQILIAAAGQMAEGNLFGRSMIADGRLIDGYCGPDTLALTFDTPGDDDSLWIYAFLNTELGLRSVRACAYGTSIPRLRPDLVADIPIPHADEETRGRVSRAIREAVAQREVYLRELRAARASIEKLAEMQEAHEMCIQRKQRTVLWSGALPTLRAWNFASAGEALLRLRREWTSQLGDHLEPDGLFKGGRLARVTCTAPHGVDLLSQSDVFAIRPVPRRIRRPSDDSLEVTDRMLLLSSRGQMNEGALFGRVERAMHMPRGAIITEDVTRLVPQTHVAAGLYAFLSTRVGLALLRSTAYGTSIPGMRMDLLAALPAPGGTVLRSCEAQVGASTRARLAAAAAEAEAVRILEEEVLPPWLA